MPLKHTNSDPGKVENHFKFYFLLFSTFNIVIILYEIFVKHFLITSGKNAIEIFIIGIIIVIVIIIKIISAPPVGCKRLID